MIGFGLMGSALLTTSHSLGIVNKLSIDIVTNTIRLTTSSIYNILSVIFGNREEGAEEVKNMINILQKLDFEYRIKIFEKLLSRLEKRELDLCILESIHGINTILIEIKDELYSLNQTIDNHCKKWFNSYRHINHESIEKLVLMDVIFSRRYSILIDLLKIDILTNNIIE